MSHPQPKKRTLVGVVVSDKMAKTVVVRVDRLKKHPKYERRYLVSRRFKAHDEEKIFHVGDKVVMEETRPFSKEKRWRVLAKIGQLRGGRLGRSTLPAPESVDERSGAPPA